MSIHTVKKPWTIYAIRNTENGKVYIGRTTNVVSRVRQHMNELKGGKKTFSEKRVVKKTLFQEDFDTYGESAFEFYILEENVKPDDADKREWHWIDAYNATDPRCGYNRRTCATKNEIVYSAFKREMPPKVEVDDR